MNNLGDFALIIGDIHIPQRATDIPEQFKDLLVPNKMQYVISPGNVGSREVSIALGGNFYQYFTELHEHILLTTVCKSRLWSG